MNTYLLVANQTLGGEHLVREAGRRAAAGPRSFDVIVPTRARWMPSPASGALVAPAAVAVAEEDEDHRAMLIARACLHQALQRLRAEGPQAHGDPSGTSRWPGMDLPGRAERTFEGPVTTVTAGA